MKKILLAFFVLFLIIIITLTKNSAKKLESEIFNIKENIRVLENKYELILLDYNFLTTPQKLMEYQSKYFENELLEIDINNIKKIEKKDNQFVISQFNKK